MGKLLLVEDDTNIQDFNKELLEEQGHTVTLAFNLKEAWERFNSDKPDLVVLDVMLPDGSGFDWLAGLRETSRVPVLMLSAKGELADRVQGYSTGADDYLPKPYQEEELVWKVSAIMKRAEKVPERITREALTIDSFSKQAFLNGVDLVLTTKEFSLLQFFIQNENQLMEAEHIYKKVWGQPMNKSNTALRTAASRLRSKIKGSGFTISMNVQNDGYCFEQEEK